MAAPKREYTHSLDVASGPGRDTPKALSRHSEPPCRATEISTEPVSQQTLPTLPTLQSWWEPCHRTLVPSSRILHLYLHPTLNSTLLALAKYDHRWLGCY